MLEQLVEKTNFVDVLIIVISSIALVAFWRGVWGLMDIYLFPYNPLLSFWASIVVGLLILLSLATYRRNHTH